MISLFSSRTIGLLLVLIVAQFSTRGQGKVEADEALLEPVVASLRQSVVYIKVSSGDGKPLSSGTGFLFSVKNGRGLVLTNEHVIRGEKGDPAQIEVVLSSGTADERTFSALLVGSDPTRDLAALEINDPDLPKPLRLGPPGRVPGELFAAGFPFGDDLSVGDSPELSITRARSLGPIQKSPPGTKWLKIDGFLNPGNSGGPLIAEDGVVHGVAVASLLGQKVGFFISNYDVATFFGGEAREIQFSPRGGKGGSISYEIRVCVSDPLARISAMEVVSAKAGSRVGGKKINLRKDGSDWVGEVTLSGKIGTLVPYNISARALGAKSKPLNTVSKPLLAVFDEEPLGAAGEVPKWILDHGRGSREPQEKGKLPKIIFADGGALDPQPIESGSLGFTLLASVRGLDHWARDHGEPRYNPSFALDHEAGILYVIENDRLSKGVVTAIDYVNKKELRRAYLPSACSIIGINQAGLILIPRSRAEVWVIDPETFQPRNSFPIPTIEPSFAPLESHLLYSRENIRKFDVWDLRTGKPIASISNTQIRESLPENVRSSVREDLKDVAVSPSGTNLVYKLERSSSPSLYLFELGDGGFAYKGSAIGGKGKHGFTIGINSKYLCTKSRVYSLDDLNDPIFDLGNLGASLGTLVPCKATKTIHALQMDKSARVRFASYSPDGTTTSEIPIPLSYAHTAELIPTGARSYIVASELDHLVTTGERPIGYGKWGFFLIEIPE